MITSIRRPGRVVGVNLERAGSKIGGIQCDMEVFTLVGVLGQGGLMSFLLGRCPRCNVTLEGAADIAGGTGRLLAWLLSRPLVSFDMISALEYQ